MSRDTLKFFAGLFGLVNMYIIAHIVELSECGPLVMLAAVISGVIAWVCCDKAHKMEGKL